MASTKKPTKDSGRKAADDATKLERLRELVAILEGSDTLSELQYEDADIVVRLSRSDPPRTSFVAQTPAPLSPSLAPAPGPTQLPTPARADGLETVESPFSGTFHRAPSPEDEAFTEVGADVSPRQVLCMIESMRLMKPVESEVTGRVVEIFPENGQPVQNGDPLFRIAVQR